MTSRLLSVLTILLLVAIQYLMAQPEDLGGDMDCSELIGGERMVTNIDGTVAVARFKGPAAVVLGKTNAPPIAYRAALASAALTGSGKSLPKWVRM
jgi:hypothetical protein